MSFRLVANSTLWQLASQIVMAALSILTVKFVAIGLTKELAGNYNSAYGFLQLFGILADFGLYAVAVHLMSSTNDKSKTLGGLLIVRSMILLMSLGLALIIAWSVPMWRHTPLPLGITIAALVPFFTLLAGIVRVIFQVTYKMQYIFVAEVTQRIITVSLIGLFIAMGIRGSNDLHIYHLFLFIGGIGAFVLFLISYVIGDRLINIRPGIDHDLIQRIVRRAFPYGLAFLCMAIYRQFDVTMIALLRPDFELQNAYYGFVVRMVEMGFLIPTFLLNSILPLLSEKGSDDERTKKIFEKTLMIILLLGTIAMLFSHLWSRPLMQLLTTESYLSTATRAGSDTALRIMAFPMLLNGIVLFCFYTLLTKHAWKRLVAIMGIGAVISIGLNLFMIPHHGFVGAAWTSVIVHIFLAISLWISTRRFLTVRIPVHHIIRWITFAILLGATLFVMHSYLINEWMTIGGLIIASILMVFWLWITGLVRVLWER